VTAVFFDLDDTLVDHSGAEYSASILFFELVRGRTHASSAEDFAALWKSVQAHHMSRYLTGDLTFQQQRRERLRDVLQPALTDTEADDLFSAYLRHYEASWRAFPDVIPCLEVLQVNHVAIITNGDAEQQQRKLAQTGLADKFAHVITSAEFGHAKPDSRIFLHACERAGVRPADAVYIGDSIETDYAGACAAGLHGILIARGKASAKTNGSITTICSLREVSSAIAKLEAGLSNQTMKTVVR